MNRQGGGLSAAAFFFPAMVQGTRHCRGMRFSASLFNLMMDMMATESTEKHGNKLHPREAFPCPSVDSVAIEIA
jgi:hypothetical protein